MSSAVGRSCANTIKRSRQNVAIATQVLSPSAIGGSLRGQRRLKHFGPPDDDEEEFISYRRRAAWKKLGYYGLAITVTILVLMGTILTVGYLQTQSKSSSLQVSRSVKLIQDAKPMSYIYSSKTTPDPPSLEPTDSQEFSPTLESSFLRSYTKDDSDDNGSLFNQNSEHLYFPPPEEAISGPSNAGEDHYQPDYNLEGDSYNNNAYDEVGAQQKANSQATNAFLMNNHNDEQNDNDDDHHTATNNESNENFISSNDKNDAEDIVPITEKERVHNDVISNNWKSDGIVDTSIVVENKEELPTKEKAVPSQGPVFSLEIPIYTNNKSGLAFPTDSAEEKNFVEEVESSEQNMPRKIKQGDKASKNTLLLGDDNGEISTESSRINKNESKDDDNDLERVEQEFATDRSKTLDNEHFHKTILHTALFHLDEEKVKKASPSATAILIEDQEIEDSTPNTAGENFNESYEATSRTNGTRNLKVKILKNDKVMNMKSTYTPPERVQQPLEEQDSPVTSEKKVADKLHAPNRGEGRRKQTHRPRNRNFHNGTRNKTASDWKLKLRVSTGKKIENDLETVKDNAFDSINVFNHPTGTSSNGHANNIFGESESRGSSSVEEKPRLLATSSGSGFLPNFESFLKAILSNVQQANSKDKSNNRFTNNLFHTTEHPLQQSPSEFGNKFANSINHLLPTPTATTSPVLGLDPSSQFRKRTFNSNSHHDFVFDINPPIQTTASLPQPENYFDRLLGQYPTVGAIGTGASLSNNFQLPTYSPLSSFPATNFNYDINQSGSNDAPELLPGMVPLNLAASYIPASGVGYGLSNNPYTGQQSQTSGFGLQNPFSNNYNTGLPAFSFPNPVTQPNGNSALDNIGSLTTAGGQAPSYNTITQGMHLLNMISGTVPSTYYHDQVYHSSQSPPASYQNDAFSLSSPTFQFSTTSPTNDFATSTNFVPGQSFDFSGNVPSPSSQPPPPPSFSLQTFDYHHHPDESPSIGDQHNILPPPQNPPLPLHFIPRSSLALKSDREAVEKFLQEDESSDQEPAASSFSQNILTTLKKKSKGKKKPATFDQTSTTPARNIITLMTKPKLQTTNLFRMPQKPNSTPPKSFSFEILPLKKNLTSKNNPSSFPNSVAIFDGLNEVSLTNNDFYSNGEDAGSSSKSKKKSGANLNMPIWKALPPSSPTDNPILSNNSPSNIHPTYYHSDIITPRNKPSINHLNSKVINRITPEKKLTKPSYHTHHAAPIGLKSGFFT